MDVSIETYMTYGNLSKLVQIGRNLFKLVGTCLESDLRTKGDAKHGGMGETNADGARTLSPGRG